MNSYNSEIYHYGIPGMKWGKRKAIAIRDNQRNHKKKLETIANSKNAHEADIKIALEGSRKTRAKVGSAFVESVASQLVGDLLSGDISNYGKHTTSQLLKKSAAISKQTTKRLVINEAYAKSVASKYDNNGNRVKGNANSRFTREQVAKVGGKASRLALVYGTGKLTKSLKKKVNDKSKARKTYDSRNGRILNATNKDYSKYITNVDFKVK